MSSDRKNLAALQSFADSLPPVERLHGLAGLAGNKIARPLAKLRENQARREAERVALLDGADSHRAKLARETVVAAGAQVAAIDGEIDRLKLEPPRLGEGEAGAYGYVRRPKSAAVYWVALVNERGEEVKSAKVGDVKGNKSGDKDAFALTVKSDALLKLAVRKGSEQVYIDKVAAIEASLNPHYRVIDLRDAPAGEEEPDKGPDPSETPEALRGLLGLTLNQALAWLPRNERILGGVVITARGDQGGHVVRAQGAERQVRLWLSLPDQDAQHLEPLAVLIAASPAAERIGIGTIAGARAALRKAEVKSLGDAADQLGLSDRDLADKFGLKGAEHGKVLRSLLEQCLRLIEVE
ncbi:MAG: hypothetical protein U9R07_02520 [Pseudomonadota bacterium]|nr:hypothetical protein [Pseudomonadota bacterium]